MYNVVEIGVAALASYSTTYHYFYKYYYLYSSTTLILGS
jgi:hypothetical protein